MILIFLHFPKWVFITFVTKKVAYHFSERTPIGHAVPGRSNRVGPPAQGTGGGEAALLCGRHTETRRRDEKLLLLGERAVRWVGLRDGKETHWTSSWIRIFKKIMFIYYFDKKLGSWMEGDWLTQIIMACYCITITHSKKLPQKAVKKSKVLKTRGMLVHPTDMLFILRTPCHRSPDAVTEVSMPRHFPFTSAPLPALTRVSCTGRWVTAQCADPIPCLISPETLVHTPEGWWGYSNPDPRRQKTSRFGDYGEHNTQRSGFHTSVQRSSLHCRRAGHTAGREERLVSGRPSDFSEACVWWAWWPTLLTWTRGQVL